MAATFPIVFHHNPNCGTSRNALAMVHAAGYEPVIIKYLETGWTQPQLQALLAAMGMQARELLRDKSTAAVELGLLEKDVPDEAILAAMVAQPGLVNRPIVATPKGVRLCRPSELVLDLLEKRPSSFTKEDGEVVPL